MPGKPLTRSQLEALRRRDERILARLEAKIAAAKAKSAPDLPPKLTTVDDLKKTGDYLDVIKLKWRGALAMEPTVITRPPQHLLIEKLICGRHFIQVYLPGQTTPQMINIKWHRAAIFDEPQFICSCGRKCRHLYPVDIAVGGGYGRRIYACTACATKNIGLRYASYSKSRSPKRAACVSVHHERDPRTGRFVKTAKLPPGFKLQPY